MTNIQRIYFLGIGGIGMSGLARYFRRRGAEVYGYDRTETELTRQLSAEGMHIHYTDDIAQIPENLDLAVFTPAIPKDLTEYLFLQQKMPADRFLRRAQMLGLISRTQRCLAVAGTHGKTTTSSILAWLLHDGGLSPSAFLGGIARNFGGNFVQGDSEWVVAEADEFDRAFLELYPEVAIVTAVDPDHLDIYGTAEEMRATYARFARQVRPGGLLLHRHGLDLGFGAHGAEGQAFEVATYGVEQGDYRAENLRVENGSFVFDFSGPLGAIRDIRFSQPGHHNVENATAAIAVAQRLGMDADAIRRALGGFAGIWRRFETILRTERHVYIDDYAHHPEEIRAAVAAARALYPGKRLTGIFQPHLFSRTRDFAPGFAEALDGLDECLLLDIYPAREQPIPGISSETIFSQMGLAHKTLLSKSELLERLDPAGFDVLLTLGAGDIDRLVGPIAERLQRFDETNPS
jgi:UDP-N-acetylmuramate--alanine ligase